MSSMEPKASSMADNTTGETQAPDRVITRIFDAPRERVWKAWTEPERLMKWWGPEIFTSPAASIDLRVGGKYHFCMRSPEGQDFWSTGFYREIVPYERLVFTDSFSDQEGNIVPASTFGMEGLPDAMLVTANLDDLGGKTRLTLRVSDMPAGEHREMAELGWKSSLDKLAASLEE